MSTSQSKKRTQTIDRKWLNIKPKRLLNRWLRARSLIEVTIEEPKVISVHGTELFRCIKNVLDYVDKHPSVWSACWGWSLLPSYHRCSLFIMEAHVVLKRSDGRLVDITPDLEGGIVKLFIPDPNVETLFRGITNGSISRRLNVSQAGKCRFCESLKS